ncbi:MAG: hypothetical protein HQ568_03200 [Calditrichaeota bacterium]|nr:hypothetical protein [Calditrichota bacterium]
MFATVCETQPQRHTLQFELPPGFKRNVVKRNLAVILDLEIYLPDYTVIETWQELSTHC